MHKIVPQTPEDLDQGSVVEVGHQEVTTHLMAAVEADKAAHPMARAVVVVDMVNRAAMVAGTVVAGVDKEVDRMARVAPVVVAMVNNSNTKVNKVAILDRLILNCWFMRREGKAISRYPIRFNLFLCLVVASNWQKSFKMGMKEAVSFCPPVVAFDLRVEETQLRRSCGPGLTTDLSTFSSVCQLLLPCPRHSFYKH